MKLRKLSPKLEKATEDYLFSIGSARERLTNEQFHVVAQYVKVRRWQPYIIMSFLMYAILQALLIIWIFRVSKSFVDSAIPSTTKKVVLISSVGEERVPTIVFRNHFMIIAFGGWLCGTFTAMLISSLMEVVWVRFNDRRRKEVLECFLPKGQVISMV